MKTILDKIPISTVAIVTGDESIVNGVVKVVLDYNTHQVMQSKRGEE